MAVNRGQIPGLKQVFRDLCSWGDNCMEYAVYMCSQVFIKSYSENPLSCPVQFTSELYNLKSSKIDPCVNVLFDKCINIKVCDRFCYNRVRKSQSDYIEGDAVKCIFCDTVVGCIYNGTVAFINVDRIVSLVSKRDAKFNISPDDRNHEYANGIIGIPTTEPEPFPPRMWALLPLTLTTWDLRSLQWSLVYQRIDKIENDRWIPILEQFKNGDIQMTRKIRDFVYVNIFNFDNPPQNQYFNYDF